jgi:exosortase family protein XrtF
MKEFSFTEFRPTIFFLGKFIGLYLAGNLLYGIYVTSFRPQPDPVTRWVTQNSAFILTTVGWPVKTRDYERKPTTLILYGDRSILSVYEGCNGLNTMIIFVAFLVAFGPLGKKLLWFIPMGLLIIHLVNLVRITVLFFVAVYYPDAMYFIHKYIFTAILYIVIFILWIWWVKRFAIIRAK